MHVRLDLARSGVGERRVDGEALAEHEEVIAAAAAGHFAHAGRVGVGTVQEIGEYLGRHVERGVHAEGVHADLVDPVSIAAPQRGQHHRVGGIQVVQARELERQLLHAVAGVVHVRRPVVDAGIALRRVGGVVHRERELARREPPAGIGDPFEAMCRLPGTPAIGVVEEIGGVVEHDVLDQVHPVAMQRARQRPVVIQRTEVRVHPGEVLGPVAVIAAEVDAPVPPLVGHRRGEPHGGCPESADVVDPALDAAQVTAVELGRIARIVFARSLIVVRAVAVVEAIDHQEVDHLVAPVRRSHMQRPGRRRCIGGVQRA